MSAIAKGSHLSVRVASDTDAWSHKREQELLAMFNEAAVDVTDEDFEEREFLLGGFSGGLRIGASWKVPIRSAL